MEGKKIRLSFDYERLHLDSPAIRAKVRAGADVVPLVELYVRADFTVRVGGGLLYAEEEFLVIELAAALARWLQVVTETEEDFVYTSVESAEVGDLWMRKADSGWRIGSVHQEYEEERTFPLKELRMVSERYVLLVLRDLRDRYGIDVSALLRC